MPKKTIITGIEHGRAAFAYAKAEDGSKLKGNSSKEYKAYTKKIPALRYLVWKPLLTQIDIIGISLISSTLCLCHESILVSLAISIKS